MPETVSIVLPALDEEAGILRAIDDAQASLEALVARQIVTGYEILVVDDGSADRTGELVALRAKHDPAIFLLVHPVNRGVGAALRTALDASTGTLVVYTDADMPVDLTVLEQALPFLFRHGVGMVAGRRRSYKAEGRLRAVGSKAYDALAHLVLGIDKQDVNFPFKLLTRDTALRLELLSEGALVDVELFARVHQVGLEVEQLVIDYRPRLLGESKTMTVRVLHRLAVELVRNGPSVRRRRPRR